MSKQFDRHKIVFSFTNKVIPEELLAENLAYIRMVCSVFLKDLRKLDKWRTK